MVLFVGVRFPYSILLFNMLIEDKLLKLSGFVIIRFPDLGHPNLKDSSNGPEDAALLDEVCDPY